MKKFFHSDQKTLLQIRLLFEIDLLLFFLLRHQHHQRQQQSHPPVHDGAPVTAPATEDGTGVTPRSPGEGWNPNAAGPAGWPAPCGTSTANPFPPAAAGRGAGAAAGFSHSETQVTQPFCPAYPYGQRVPVGPGGSSYRRS